MLVEVCEAMVEPEAEQGVYLSLCPSSRPRNSSGEKNTALDKFNRFLENALGAEGIARGSEGGSSRRNAMSDFVENASFERSGTGGEANGGN